MNYRKETELGPDAIQKWCEELDRKPKMEMSKEEEDIFLRCKAYESNIRHFPECQKMLKGWNAAAILNERVKSSHTYTLELSVLVFFGAILDRPGIVVQYANYMQYKCWQHGIKNVDMESFSRYICPMGFFSEETLHEMWEKQKIIPKDGGGLANMLDHPEFMESIREIKEK